MEQHFTIEIENLKCGGCANTITKSLSNIKGVENVFVDETTDIVSFTCNQELVEVVAGRLKSLGYPERGSVHGLESGIATAKSYVSCAIGKFN